MSPLALMAGEVASLLLSRMAVPVLYYLLARRHQPAVVMPMVPAEVYGSA